MKPLARPLSCFKAYDIRGRLDDDLTVDTAFRIGRAFAQVLDAKEVVLGRDVRPSSESLARGVAEGLMTRGGKVLDLGLSGTEETYFATAHLGASGGICVTASHNPMDYNGMKLVRAGAAPIGPDSGLNAVKALAESGAFDADRGGGGIVDASGTRAAYVESVVAFTSTSILKKLKILINAGNGTAGPTFDDIAERLAVARVPWVFERMHHQPDQTFPNGIPNPLLPENQPVTTAAVRAAGADFGVAWDGDFDRCFFFDHEGSFVPGEYIVALLAEVFLAKSPGARIVHDPRVIWSTQDRVAQAGGTAIMSRCGHTNMKQTMRDEDAIYGGEMSAHHYFRDFHYCDSGMIPWLLIGELMSRTGATLKELVSRLRMSFPSSGEVNFRVADNAETIARIEAIYAPHALARDDLDGLSLSFDAWRFNLRASNTEPLLRLNIEARDDPGLVVDKLAEMERLISRIG